MCVRVIILCNSAVYSCCRYHRTCLLYISAVQAAAKVPCMSLVPRLAYQLSTPTDVYHPLHPLTCVR